MLEKDGQHRQPGTTVVLAGESQPPFVHALAHALNLALGNVGKTVFYTDPVEAHSVDQTSDLRDLVRDLEAGRVELLFILGSNPAYDSPIDLDFGRRLQEHAQSGRAGLARAIHLGLYQDETAVGCDWHVPEAHYLESWSDARAFDGTVTIMQPLIEPLYQGVSIHEFLAALTEESAHDGRGLLRRYWWQHLPDISDDISFERAWERCLRDGLIEGSALKPQEPPALKSQWARQQPEAPPRANASGSEMLEINFRPDPTIYDGRFANNGWLQELPKPLSKLTWDNAILVSPATAQRLGLKQSFGIHGGEHGEARVDMVEVEYDGRRIQGPAWILPGHADDSITIQLGYGRTSAGNVGSHVGFNAYLLRSAEHPWFDSGVQIRLTGERYTLACTQMHHSMEEREPVLVTSLQNYHHPEKQSKVESDQAKDRRLIPLSLYPEQVVVPSEHKWGMVIDLAGCIGCSACVVACQAENNIPVVGKIEVTRGREMHWLRIDRYYTGEPEDADKLTHPLLLEQLPLRSPPFQLPGILGLRHGEPEAGTQSGSDRANAGRHGKMHVLRAAHPRGSSGRRNRRQTDSRRRRADGLSSGLPSRGDPFWGSQRSEEQSRSTSRRLAELLLARFGISHSAANHLFESDP